MTGTAVARSGIARLLGSALLGLLAFTAPAGQARSDSAPAVSTAPSHCATALRAAAGWSETEIWTWDRLCRGLPARLDARDAEPLPCNPAEMSSMPPPDRWLSARFLELIVTNRALIGALPEPELRIACADIHDRVDLTGERITPGLVLTDSRLLHGAILKDAHFERSLILSRTVSPARLDARSVHVAGDLRLDGAAFHREALFTDSKIDGTLNGRGAAFHALLEVEGGQIGGDLRLDGNAWFGGNVQLEGLEIGGTLTAAGSHFAGLFDASGTDIAGSVNLGDGARFERDVVFDLARTRGDVNADASTFGGSLKLDTAQIDGDVFLRDVVVEDDTVLIYTRVGGTLVAEGAQFEGRVGADALRVDGNLLLRNGSHFGGEVALKSAEVGGAVEIREADFRRRLNASGLRAEHGLLLGEGAHFSRAAILQGAWLAGDLQTLGARFDGGLEADEIAIGGNLLLSDGSRFDGVSLRQARIEGALRLSNGHFAGPLDLSGAHVEREIRLSSSPLDGPTWSADASLDLRGASTGLLSSDLSAWRRGAVGWVPTELTGFIYDRIGGGVGATPSGGSDDTAALLIGWIEGAQPNHDARYDPQPYTALATALSTAGDLDAARAVSIARFEHKRRAASTSWWQLALLYPSGWFFGYGLEPFRLLWWFLALVALGAVVSVWSRSDALGETASKLLYSLENATLLDARETATVEHEHGDAWVARFFRAQRALGLAIAIGLIAALTLIDV